MQGNSHCNYHVNSGIQVWHAACKTISETFKSNTMKELKKKYQEAKAKAKKLMSDGRLSEYIAQLVTVEQLKLQLINATITESR